ncbi:MAG: ribonuclease HII [Deltaproteobacteria bacterium]|nr:ribonuclease HII [Deltaproteobacteria bacterium]
MEKLNFAKGTIILGVDEAGRGPLAGPVTAACVCFPEDYRNDQINDSKKLSHTKREKLYTEITANALAYSIISIGAKRIDKHNILGATKLAMLYAVKRVARQLKNIHALSSSDFLVIIDGNQPIKTTLCQQSIVKGDSKVMQIAAASILAKVTRDRLMSVLDNKFPQYGFSIHKGYPTVLHLQKVAEHGPCAIHRLTFRGVREHVGRLETY